MKRQELNASLVALALLVSRNPAVAAEIDSELPPDSHTSAILEEARQMLRGGATNSPLTEKHGLQHSSVRALVEQVEKVGYIPSTCHFCSDGFMALRRDTKYCSLNCRKKADHKKSLVRKANQRERAKAKKLEAAS